MENGRRHALQIPLLLLIGLFAWNSLATAQLAPADRSLDEALIRQELQRIIAEDPSEADNARRTLQALDQPDSSPEGRQLRSRRERGARRIVNGIPALAHPAVGALLYGADRRTAKVHCTGTLVGCDKFLTAAHCIAKDPREEIYHVYLQEAGIIEVARIDWPKQEYSFPYFDLAMLTLKRPVSGVAPIAINTSTTPVIKSVAAIVGFGRTGGSRYDYGIKREGSALTEACTPQDKGMGLICWRFDADVKSRPSQSNTCNGDSGGGVFMTDVEQGRTVQKVFGVVSGGSDENCVKDDLSYNVDVFQFRSWITKVGEGRLSSRLCGREPVRRVGGASQKYIFDLDAQSSEHTVGIDVPSETGTLRISMNGEQKGNNDFDLYVYSGNSVSGPAACEESATGQIAFCEFDRPTVGSWRAVVKRKHGEGKVQLTVGVLPPER